VTITRLYQPLSYLEPPDDGPDPGPEEIERIMAEEDCDADEADRIWWRRFQERRELNKLD